MLKKNMVCITSYLAANAFINYCERSTKDLIVLGPDLGVFKEYFAEFTECLVIEREWNNKKYWSFLKSRQLQRITYWGYALSDIALSTVHFARCLRIPIHIVLPAPVADKLYQSQKIEIRVLMRNWKALPKMLLYIIRGWPIVVKTFNNYVYDCIDTRVVSSVKTFSEVVSCPLYSTTRYNTFVDYIKNQYFDKLKNIVNCQNLCVVLDENFAFYEKCTGTNQNLLKHNFAKALDHLFFLGYKVYLKPTYYGTPNLSKHFQFTGIIPGEIPLQVLDHLVPQNTIVTGLSATFLQERMINMKPVAFGELVNSKLEIRNITNAGNLK